MAYYTTVTTLTEEELRNIRSDIASDERDWSTATTLEAIDPETSEIHVSYRTTPSKVRHIVLKLAADGTDLTLSRIIAQ